MYLGLVLPDPRLVIQPIGLSLEQYLRDSKLIDYDVNYYGFFQSKEYREFYINSLMSDIQTMEFYFSPYFGSGSSAYRELDKVYESYKENLPITTMPIIEPVRPVPITDSGGGISPALILAAAAAFFFAG